VFELAYPELALLRFAVEEADFVAADPFIGQATFPIDCLRTGERGAGCWVQTGPRRRLPRGAAAQRDVGGAGAECAARAPGRAAPGDSGARRGLSAGAALQQLVRRPFGRGSGGGARGEDA